MTMITTQTLMIFFTTSSLLIINLFQTCDANCNSSSCGIIPNISFPFRLNEDPNHCGDRRFELSCENNVTFVYLNSHKFNVKSINYSSSTIRLVDASINDDDICSFPTVSAYRYNFTAHPPSPDDSKNPKYKYDSDLVWPINLISCPNPLKNTSLFTDITQCFSSLPRFTYVNVFSMKASEIPLTCGVDLMVITSWRGFKDFNNVSLSQIHQSLLYGFELYFCYRCGRGSTNWGKKR